MPRDHPFRRAVVNEGPGAGRLEAQHRLLARIDVSERAAAKTAGRGVEVNVVRHRVGLGIDQREFDVVALMHHHHRPRNRAVECHGLELGAGIVDDDFLLADRQLELHDLRAALGNLLVRMHERRRHQFDLLARQLEIVGQGRRGNHKGCNGGAHQCGSAGDHDTLLFGARK